MSENIAEGLPTQKDRIRKHIEMAVDYLGLAFSHLKDAEDLSESDFHNLNVDISGYSNEISRMLRPDHDKPGLNRIAKVLKSEEY